MLFESSGAEYDKCRCAKQLERSRGKGKDMLNSLSGPRMTHAESNSQVASVAAAVVVVILHVARTLNQTRRWRLLLFYMWHAT